MRGCRRRSCSSSAPTPAAPTVCGSTRSARTPEELEKNNLPDVLRRWGMRTEQERARARTEQSFCVPKADIEAQGYDLSLNRHKEVVHEEIEHRSPEEILDELERIEKEIAD